MKKIVFCIFLFFNFYWRIYLFIYYLYIYIYIYIYICNIYIHIFLSSFHFFPITIHSHFEMVFVFKESSVMSNLDFIALQNSNHLQLMFNVLVNIAKLELLFTNFAMNLTMLSSISTASKMTPNSKYIAQFAVESPTPRILF